MKPSANEILDYLYTEKEVSPDYPWKMNPEDVSPADTDLIADLTEEMGGDIVGLMNACDLILGTKK